MFESEVEAALTDVHCLFAWHATPRASCGTQVKLVELHQSELVQSSRLQEGYSEQLKERFPAVYTHSVTFLS